MEYNAIPWKTQTMIAANSCMTVFLSFSLSLSLSLSRSPTQNRTRQASAKIPSGRKRMRKLPNEVNEGATSPLPKDHASLSGCKSTHVIIRNQTQLPPPPPTPMYTDEATITELVLCDVS
jgi:hypothetical protein